MVRVFIIAVMVAITVSIGFAIWAYLEWQPNFIYVNGGESVQVGPVKYIIEYIGEHSGDENTSPEHTFVQISIIAENVGKESTRMTGGQFHIFNEDNTRVQPVYGNFSENDLLNDILEQHVPVFYTTQFDIPYDENKQYRIGIKPTKEQASMDIGMVCIINC